MAEKKMGTTQALLTLAIVGAGAWYFFGGGLEKQAASDMAKIEGQVATDAVQQYQIVSRNGSPIDKCVHAQLVAAAFVQAKDEANYAKWKGTQRADCKAAGMPEQ